MTQGKWTIGVKIFAVLFILSGVVGTFQMATQLFSGNVPNVAGQQFDKTMAGIEKRAGSPEEVEKMKKVITESKPEIDRINNSIGMRLFKFFTFLVSLATLIAGGGLLVHQEWARVLVFWKSGASVLSGIFGMYYIFLGYKVIERLSLTFQDQAAEPGKQVMVLVGFSIGLLVSFAWFAFIVWFFTRPAVKAQFQAGKQKP